MTPCDSCNRINCLCRCPGCGDDPAHCCCATAYVCGRCGVEVECGLTLCAACADEVAIVSAAIVAPALAWARQKITHIKQRGSDEAPETRAGMQLAVGRVGTGDGVHSTAVAAAIDDALAPLALRELWDELRDDFTVLPQALACARFAHRLGLIDGGALKLWIAAFNTCPGHDGDSGRSWCAYCGELDKPKDSDGRTDLDPCNSNPGRLRVCAHRVRCHAGR